MVKIFSEIDGNFGTKELFRKRVEHWVAKFQARPTAIHVGKIRLNKWAFCSSTNRLYFNIGLLKESVDFQDHVILHEVLHLFMPNHGSLFKRLLKCCLSLAKDEREIACLKAEINGGYQFVGLRNVPLASLNSSGNWLAARTDRRMGL